MFNPNTFNTNKNFKFLLVEEFEMKFPNSIFKFKNVKNTNLNIMVGGISNDVTLAISIVQLKDRYHVAVYNLTPRRVSDLIRYDMNYDHVIEYHDIHDVDSLVELLEYCKEHWAQ